MNKNLMLIAGAIVFREKGGKREWFIVGQKAKEPVWEFPKMVTRKTESSVRAAIRMMGEKGGMNARVLEEVGRAGGSTIINGRQVPQRYLYYLMKQLAAGEVLGFEEYAWLDYSKAMRKLSSKREKTMLRQARKILKDWLKRKKAGGSKAL